MSCRSPISRAISGSQTRRTTRTHRRRTTSTQTSSPSSRPARFSVLWGAPLSQVRTAFALAFLGSRAAGAISRRRDPAGTMGHATPARVRAGHGRADGAVDAGPHGFESLLNTSLINNLHSRDRKEVVALHLDDRFRSRRRESSKRAAGRGPVSIARVADVLSRSCKPFPEAREAWATSTLGE